MLSAQEYRTLPVKPAENACVHHNVTAGRAKLISEIDGYREMIRRQEHAWATFFRAERTTPFVVRYEELVADPASVICDVLRSLRLPIGQAPDLDALRLRPLPDARNALLCDAYAAEREGLVDEG